MGSYYVRSRGKVAGPFDMDALQQLVKRGKVSRFDQLSADKAAWRNASEYSELFAAAAPRRAPAMAVGGGGGAIADEGSEEIGLVDVSPAPTRAASARSAGTDFYYAQNGVAIGPVTLAVLQSLATNGTLRGDDQVWAAGSEIASPARQVPMLATHFSGRGPSLGYAGSYGETRDAGFWLRVVASILDGIITTVLFVAIALVLGFMLGAILGANDVRPQKIQDYATMLGVVVQIVVPWLYHTLLESSGLQATLGKRALGLSVTGADGGRISFARASGRYFAKILSGLTLGIGFVLAAFTPRKQALHDMICSTYVVQK